MNTYDDFWRRAMAGAYRPLTAIEQAALLPLAVAWSAQGVSDRFHASIPVLQDDGSARMTCLTIDQVESYGHAYAEKHYSIEACHEPEGDSR